ncbi:MAG: hypothetical protein ACXV78_00290 [Candidatus Angelobacter sp.]
MSNKKIGWGSRQSGIHDRFGEAILLKETILQAQRALATVHMVASMGHHINNPLQGAIFAVQCSALHHAKSQPDLNPTMREMILPADHELEPRGRGLR